MGKIVIINHYGVTPDMPGPSKNYEMSKYFADNCDVDSEFWICGFSHYTNKINTGLKHFKLQHIIKCGNHKTVFIRSTPYKKSSILRQLNIIVFDLITSLKILFSRNINCVIITVPPISVLNVLAVKIRNIKLVADVQDLWPLFLKDMGLKNKFVIKYMDFFANILYRHSDGVSAVSNGMVNYIQNIVVKKRIWLSPLGVNINEFRNKTLNKDLIKNKEWCNDFKIMYLGVHGKANDLQSVISVIKEFNDKFGYIHNSKKTSFIFIGDGEQKSNLINETSKLKLENVYFENAVPSNLVPDYLIHADICLTNLMKIESFKLVCPNKLFQYMALGKPIISGIWGEFKDIIQKNNSGIYVDFTQPKDAVYKIYMLINNELLLNDMGRNGIKYIENFGDRTKIFKDYYENLSEIIKETK